MNAPPAVKDLEDQIAEEHAILSRASQHIADGRDRLHRQCDLVSEMRTNRFDTRHAERLAQVLQGTLDQWELHRTMVVERIAYLEGQRRHA